MAFGLKEWFLAAGGGALVLAVWLLPPDPPDVRAPTGPSRDSAASEARPARIRALGLQSVLSRIVIRDTVERRVAEGRASLEIMLPETVPDSVASRRRRAVEDRLDDLGMADPRVTLVRGILPSGLGAHDAQGWRWDGETGWLILHGVVEGEPYCAVVYRSARPERAASEDLAAATGGREDREPLHFCRFHARYGPPGPEVARWLEEEGGFGLAMVGTSYVPSVWFRGLYLPFGWNTVVRVGDVEEARCLAGDEVACAKTILGRSDVSPPSRRDTTDLPRAPGYEPYYFRWGGYGLSYFGFGYAYLADLEDAFGTASFRAFWTSDQPVARAFESAFGESVGGYTHRWAAARLAVREPGPGVAAGSAGLSLLLISGLVGAAIWVGQRRSVT